MIGRAVDRRGRIHFALPEPPKWLTTMYTTAMQGTGFASVHPPHTHNDHEETPAVATMV
jgi:hypothetical protein